MSGINEVLTRLDPQRLTSKLPFPRAAKVLFDVMA